MSDISTSASNSIILRLRIQNIPGIFASVVAEIGKAGGDTAEDRSRRLWSCYIWL